MQREKESFKSKEFFQTVSINEEMLKKKRR